MLKFNQIPPTVDGTEIDPEAIRVLAYGYESRCINGVAEVAASIVVANTIDLDVIRGIGEKIGGVVARSKQFRNPEDDRECFVSRYHRAATFFLSKENQARGSEYADLTEVSAVYR